MVFCTHGMLGATTVPAPVCWKHSLPQHITQPQPRGLVVPNEPSIQQKVWGVGEANAVAMTYLASVAGKGEVEAWGGSCTSESLKWSQGAQKVQDPFSARD